MFGLLIFMWLYYVIGYIMLCVIWFPFGIRKWSMMRSTYGSIRKSSARRNEETCAMSSGLPCDYLTHCDLVTPYDGKDHCQHWRRSGPVAGQQQTIIWTHVDLPSIDSGAIHLNKLTLEIVMQVTTTTHLTITQSNSNPYLLGDNEFR